MNGKKILVIDDTMDLARAVGVRLKSAGYEVEIAYDAVQGTSMAVSGGPDLILLDLGLPGGNGYEMLKNFKLLSSTCHIPIIVFTARGQSGEEKAMQLGAAAYLVKPCESQKLLSTIRTVLASGEITEPPSDMLG